MFPPSVHECGEQIDWSSTGDALRVGAGELESAVSKLCSAAVVAKYWREGIRQDLALAVSGALLRHGFDEAEAKHFIRAICSTRDDAEVGSRVQAVDSAAERLAKGENCYGLPKLAELTDQKIVDSLCDWLGIEAQRDGRQIVRFVGEPKPLDFTLKPVPKLEDGCLPEVLIRWLRPASRVIGCPYDFLVLSAIVTAGSLIGARVRVKVVEHSDWFVVPNLYGGIIGAPSTKKTPALDETQKPLSGLQNHAREVQQKEISDYEIEQLFYEKAKKEIVKNSTSAADAKELLSELIPPVLPTLRRYRVNDVTTPKLIEYLSENPNGTLLVRDELVGWLRAMENDYERSARAFVLELWKGAIDYDFARVDGRDIPLKSGTLSVLGGIQPSKLQKYVAEAYSFDNSDGFLQRYLFTFPDFHPGTTTPSASDFEAKNYGYEMAQSLFQELAGRDFDGKCVSANGDRFLAVTLEKEAQKRIDRWIGETEFETHSIQAKDEALAAYLYKLPKTCLSIALIFHCLEFGKAGSFPGEINLATIEKALGYTAYLVSHARRVFALGENEVFDLARKLVDKIKDGDLKQGFTLREIMRKKWSGFRSKDDVSEVLVLLVEYGYLVSEANVAGRTTSKFYFHESLGSTENGSEEKTKTAGNSR